MKHKSILNKLTFTIKDLMVPSKSLICANTQKEALDLSNKYNYSIIPFREKNKIIGYFDANNSVYNNISKEHLLSSDTEITKLPELFYKKMFYFVISADKIIGYIHFSDLNNPIVKVYYFILYERFESKLFDSVNKLNKNEIINLIERHKADRIISKRERKERDDVDNAWKGTMSFRDIIHIYNKHTELNLNNKQIELLNNIRNRVAHSDHLLINKHQEINEIIDFVKIIKKVLKKNVK